MKLEQNTFDEFLFPLTVVKKSHCNFCHSITQTKIKKKQKDKTISEDQSKNYEKNIQKLTDTNIENIEKILSIKEKEIIQI